MARVIVPLADGFEEIEAVTVTDVLRRAGIEVVMAGVPGSLITGSRGIRVYADKRFYDTSPDDFDAIAIPGGSQGCANLMKTTRVTDMIKDFDSKKKIIAAICAAPSMLAKLGVLEKKRATIYPGMERELIYPRHDMVVVDEHIVTSRGPGTAIPFALKLVEMLAGRDTAIRVKKELVY